MKRLAHTPVPDSPVPEGYGIEYFTVGSERDWAEIETSVLEFSQTTEAVEYFSKEYLPFPDDLRNRTIFLVSPQGEKVGTATAWWSYKGEKKIQSIHWVAVKPSHQRMGLGRAIINRATSLSLRIDGDNDIYIHTQTWSHQAIRLYLEGGYRIQEKETFGQYRNDFEQALPLLKGKTMLGRPLSDDTI